MWTNGNIYSFFKDLFPKIGHQTLHASNLPHFMWQQQLAGDKENKIKKLVSKHSYSLFCGLPQWLHPAHKADFVTLETLQEANFKTFFTDYAGNYL